MVVFKNTIDHVLGGGWLVGGDDQVTTKKGGALQEALGAIRIAQTNL